MTKLPLLTIALILLTSPVAVADPAPTPTRVEQADSSKTYPESANSGHDPEELLIDIEFRSKEMEVQSQPGSPAPKSILDPHMPGVDVLTDMDALFVEARRQGKAQTNGGGVRVGASQVVLVTPGRMFVVLPTLDPKQSTQWPMDPVDAAKSVLGSDTPVIVSVVSYTSLEAMVEDQKLRLEGVNRSIPFIGIMIGWAYAGHSVIVFEGHPSAFKAGVRNSDVLIVDSAMLPFLQKDWRAVAFGVMHPDARIFVHDRKSYTLQRV